MIPKFSVKRPYTVIVGIILVVVLGVVSLTGLSTDLLPDINLPYAIVMTTYMGASPDTVEARVTIPVEESMATVSGIENISSMSNENYSVVILEYDEGTNMDSVTVEMREKLDQLEAVWDNDNISTPLILKINPDMAPVLVAAVDMDGKDQKQLTDYVNDNLLSKLESLGGVASVSAAGQIEAEIQVVVRQDKIDRLNERITSLLDEQFGDAQKKLDDGAEELKDGKDELQEQKDSLSRKLAEGSNTVIDNKIQLISSKAQLQQQITTLETQLTQVNEGLKQIQQAEQAKKQLESGIKTLEELRKQAEELEKARSEAQTALEQLKNMPQPPADLPDQLPTDFPDQLPTDLPDQLPTDIPDQQSPEQPSGNQDDPAPQITETDPAETPEQSEPAAPEQPDSEPPAEQPSVSSNPTANSPQAMIAQLEATIAGLDQGLEKMAEGLKAQGITLKDGEKVSDALQNQIEQLRKQGDELDQALANKASLVENQQKLEQGISKLKETLEQIESGETALSDALTSINQSGILASIEMGSATAQMESAQSAIDNAQSQLDSAKESAYDSADADKLLSVSTVTSLLTAQNFDMPAGYITEGDDSLLVRVGDSISTLEELRTLPLMDLGMDGLDTVTLEDVADVIVKDNSDDVYAKVNGNGALILSLVKQDGYSTGDVSKTVLKRFDKLEREIPGLHFTVLSDQGVYIDMVIHSVLQTMLYGAVLAVIVLFLFLKDLRPTMIIAVSIPVSTVLALVFMYMAHISINIMSLGGLSLGIGMLVDNSVVVLENIYRYRSMGYNIWSAAVAGTKEVLGAIVASTLTTVCVFVGLFFSSGIVIELLISLALSFTFALLGSLIIAMTFVPMMSSFLMRKERKIRHGLFDGFLQVYSRFLSVCLRFKAVVILLAVVLLFVTGSAVLRQGFSFMPEMASTQASVSLTTPVELSFHETMEIADQVAERLGSIQDVETVGVQSGSSGMMAMMASSMFGGAATGDSDANAASFYVVFSEERTISNEDFTRQALEKCADLNCELNVDTASMDITALSGNGITVRLYGKDKDRLQELAQTLGTRLEGIEGVSNVDNGLTESSDQLKVSVDKGKAAEHSLTVAQVFQTIAGKIATPTAITTLELDEGSFELYVKKDSDQDMTRSDLRNITLEPPAGTGAAAVPSDFGLKDDKDEDKKEQEDEKDETIRLSDIAEISTVMGMDTINRYNQQRYLSLTAYVKDGYNVTLVSNAIQTSLGEFDFPDGYYVDYSGESETIMEAMLKLVEMLLLALICIYLIMVAQFQSLLHPFIIMFTIPLAFTGGFMALLLAHTEINVLSMIGFVLLSGVIVNNGIVLIDYINQLRTRGMEKREAILQAGRTRMRPVLMTTLTTVFAQTFMALGQSMDAALLRPMALVTVGGLTYGTIMTLVFVPCIYDLFTSSKPMEEHEIDDTLLEEISE